MQGPEAHQPRRAVNLVAKHPRSPIEVSHFDVQLAAIVPAARLDQALDLERR